MLEEDAMPIYIMLSNITDEGAKKIKKSPERIKEVNAEIERLGVKVLSQYATLGLYDFINVVEAPDNMAVARVSAELASRGTIKITTLPAIDVEEFIRAFSQ
jgi:uncharacterized protein with GYD domain